MAAADCGNLLQVKRIDPAGRKGSGPRLPAASALDAEIVALRRRSHREAERLAVLRARLFDLQRQIERHRRWLSHRPTLASSDDGAVRR